MHSTYILTPEAADESFGFLQQRFRDERPFVLQRAGAIDHDDKEDGSPVTDADREIERRVTEDMARRFPGLPVLGEETGYDENKLPPVCWLIDPIDGTKSFIAGEPMFTSMAVLIERSEGVAGAQATACIIYNHATDDMFTARLSGGAYKNDTRLRLADAALPPVAWCKGELIQALNAIVRPAGVQCEQTRGGGGFGFTQVAEGLVAARFQIHARGYVHDYAPGALLVREAGGCIVPLRDNPYTYQSRSFVACHPALRDVLAGHVQLMCDLDAAR